MLTEVYGKNTMSCSRDFEWHKRLKDGREEVEDDEHPVVAFAPQKLMRTSKKLTKLSKMIHVLVFA